MGYGPLLRSPAPPKYEGRAADAPNMARILAPDRHNWVTDCHSSDIGSGPTAHRVGPRVVGVRRSRVVVGGPSVSPACVRPGGGSPAFHL